MSLAAHPLIAPGRKPTRLMQLGLALGAILIVCAVAALLASLLMPSAAMPVPRNPFGIGIREAAPSTTGLGSFILARQASFNRALEAALVALRRDGGAPWLLVMLGFAYGVFHAAGPGHGKGVIAAYLVSNERALVKGFGVGLAAALLQGVVAITVVSVAAILFRATAPTVTRVTDGIEMASFAGITLLGGALAWRKAGKFLGVFNRGAGMNDGSCAPGACSHAHVPGPDVMARSSFAELAGVVLAAGLRPCAGAILILVFALSQKLFWAGILATLAMSLGTALTTGSIAALAVFAKQAALRLAGRNPAAEVVGAGCELFMAAFVVVLGISLLLGLSAGFIAG